jgi:hypothetical protein
LALVRQSTLLLIALLDILLEGRHESMTRLNTLADRRIMKLKEERALSGRRIALLHHLTSNETTRTEEQDM